MKLFPFSSASRTWLARQSDPTLIAECLAGNHHAWDALIERFAPLINTLATRMGLSTSDAADVFQEVCLLLLNHLENLRDHSRLAAWIVVTTRHEVYRLYRKRGPKVVSELSDGELWMMDNLTDADQVSSMDEHVIALDRRLRLKLAIEGMPDRCRGLLTLLYLNDPAESYINIAEKLQIPTGSIGPVRTRCLKRLRKILENEDF